eukprot:6489975-Amphidinium_carterae.1
MYVLALGRSSRDTANVARASCTDSTAFVLACVNNASQGWLLIFHEMQKLSEISAISCFGTDASMAKDRPNTCVLYVERELFWKLVLELFAN